MFNTILSTTNTFIQFDIKINPLSFKKKEWEEFRTDETV